MFGKLGFGALLLIGTLFWMVSISGHEGHDKSKQQESTQNSDDDPDTTTVPQTESRDQEGVPVEVRPIPMPFSGPIQEHAHNKLVHLPIGLGLAGVLFAFIALKKPELLTAVRVLWLLAALAGIGAYFTGEAQEEPFENGELHEVVELHEKLGIGTAIALGIGFLISLSRRLKGLAAIWSIIVLGMILVTGYYGGVLAHS